MTLRPIAIEILALKRSLEQDVYHHGLKVAATGSDRELYDEMKRLVRILEAALLQTSAKRRSLRQFHQYLLSGSLPHIPL